METCIIIVAGSDKQNRCIWPSYQMFDGGIEHDIILVHRNYMFLPESIPDSPGKVIMENKCNPEGTELANKAFGAYREYWSRYADNYDFFGFISDDVMIRSDGWLKRAVEMLIRHDKLGFVGTQIFNAGQDGKKYPHKSHCRAPAWFAKSAALSKINWSFSSDHVGEMSLAESFLEAGYFGAQVGNKIDIAYDVSEKGRFYTGDHISAIMEKRLRNKQDIINPASREELKKINERLHGSLTSGNIDDLYISSPFPHIGERNIVSDLEPFHGLLYDKSYELASRTSNIKTTRFGISILEQG